MTDGEKIIKAWKELSDPEMKEILGVFSNKACNESEMGRELYESQMASHESTDNNEHIDVYNTITDAMRALRKARKNK